ncbi:MAG: hypothetical protein A2Y61_03920 [Chloroflexi bacterium RBG_13_60_13]|nr:MAG: hypothetical protein A2Y61_03920 [Chloroflexi bacterium RBG_13_60_13]
MKTRAPEDMKPNSRKCPHCDSDTVDFHLPFRAMIFQSCPVCRCRFRSDGKHVVAGKYCPLQIRLPLEQ